MITLFTWLASAAWKGSLLLLPVVVLVAALRDFIPPRWRFALLFVAMLRLVVPFAPAAPFSIFNLAQRDQRPAPPRISVGALPSGAPVRFIAFPRSTPPAPPFAKWRPLLALVWALGALALIARVVLRSLRVHRRIHRDAGSAPPPHLQHLLENCRETLSITRNVELRLTNAVSSPSLHGVWRPALLLPADLPSTLTADQLRFVFLHELAHLRRHDVLLNWSVTFIHALHWFNPLVWFAATRLAEDRELACDSLALEHLGRQERGAYGETVIQLLDRLRMPSPVPALVGMAPTRHQAKRRIQMIASFRNESRRAAWFAVAVVALALVSLTDATAGDRVMLRHSGLLSAEAKATMETLNKTMNTEFTNVHLEDVVNAVSNATGVSFKFADDALTSEVRAGLITIQAKDVPAHVVLNETLAAFDLGVRFSAEGNTIVKEDEISIPRVIRVATEDGRGRDDRRVIIVDKRRVDESSPKDADALPDLPELKALVEAHEANTVNVRVRALKDADGTVTRHVNYVGKDDVQGSLTIKVIR